LLLVFINGKRKSSVCDWKLCMSQGQKNNLYLQKISIIYLYTYKEQKYCTPTIILWPPSYFVPWKWIKHQVVNNLRYIKKYDMLRDFWCKTRCRKYYFVILPCAHITKIYFWNTKARSHCIIIIVRGNTLTCYEIDTRTINVWCLQ